MGECGCREFMKGLDGARLRRVQGLSWRLDRVLFAFECIACDELRNINL